VHRIGADLQDGLEFVDEFERVLRFMVALVDEREDGHPAFAADLEELARLRFDAFGGVDDHHHGIHRGEDAVRVLRKVLMSRRVKQVDAVAVVVELEHGGADGDAALPLEFHPVGCGRALVLPGGDAAGELHGAAVEQEFFG